MTKFKFGFIIKEMFRTIFNKFIMVIYFVVGALILEALTFSVLDFGGLPEYFWYNFAIILIIALTFYIIPSFKGQFIAYTVMLAIQTILIYINYSLTRVYGDLLSIEMIRLVGEAGAAMTASFVYIAVILELILVYTLIVIFGVLLLRYCKKDKNHIKHHFSVFSIILIISVQLFSVGFSVQTREKINAMTSLKDASYALTDEFLMNTSILKTSSYKKFGTYGYFTNMIFNAIRNEGSAIEKVTLDYFNAGSIYGEAGNSSDVFGIDKGNNVIVVMMESLEWFGFGDGNYDSEFNNLSYEFAPNIYGLMFGEDYLTDTENSNKDNDAILAKNFFAKSKTNMSEGQGIIGNYPVAQPLTDIARAKTPNALGYAMPAVMQRLGYKTSYIHSHEIGFYSRGSTHQYLGFNTVVGKDGVLDSNGKPVYTDMGFDNWDAEGNFARNAIDYIVPKDRSKPFYSFYLNVSSHGAYNASDNKKDGDALKYYDYVKYGEDDCEIDNNGYWKLKNTTNPTYTNFYKTALEKHPTISEDLVYYQCGVKGLDDAIGVIINKLKEYGIYDNTTMLLYSDHYAYYDSLSHIFKGLSVTNNNVKELNIIPMIISSPGIKQLNSTLNEKYLVNTRFSSAYDVVPTLFDLLGVKFNERLYLGHSLFRPSDYVYTENGVTKDMVVYYSNTGGLFGDNIYTFDLKRFITPLNYSEETIDIFSVECTNILTKINFLSFLNRYNLYGKLTNV